MRIHIIPLLLAIPFLLSHRFSLADDAPAKRPSPPTDLYGDPLPSGAVARMGSVRLRHAGLADFIYMRDGKTLLSAGGDRVLRYWDVATGQQTRATKLQGMAGPGECINLARNGKTLAAIEKGRITIWEVASGKELKTISPPKAEVVYLYLSPDGDTLAVGRDDCRVTLFDWPKGTQRDLNLPALKTKNNRFTTHPASFSPDGNWYVAGAGLDEPLGVFDVATGREVYRLDCHPYCSRVAPEGKTLGVVSSQNDQGGSETVIRLFDLASGKELAQFPQGDAIPYYYLAFSEGGKIVACGFERSCLLDSATGRVLLRLPGWQNFPSIAPDGKALVTYEAHRLRCWDLVSGKERHQWPGEFGYNPVLAVSPDGQRLASADWIERTIDLWDTATGRQIHSLPLKAEQRYVRNLAFADDGQRLLASQSSGITQFWEVATGKEQRLFELKNTAFEKKEHVYFFQLHTSPDAKHVSTLERMFGPEGTTETTRLGLWETATGKLLRHHSLPAETRDCAWLAGGASIAYPQKDGLTLMEIDTGAVRWHARGTASRGPLAASPDDRLVAIALTDSRNAPMDVGIWEVATGKKVAKVATGRVAHLAVASDNRSLVTTDEGFFRVWDLATGKERYRWPLPGTGLDSEGSTFVFRLVLSPGGRRAFTALADGTALVWDLSSSLNAADLLVKDPGAIELGAWWTDMAGDPDKAYAAVWRLAEVNGGAAVSFLKKNLKPATERDFQKIVQLITDLGSESFKDREHARKQLELLGGAAMPAMRQALATNPSLEVRRRLETLLSRPLTYALETLRELRAIQVLERIASGEARRLLTDLANGMVNAPQTQEAKASLERLARRDAKSSQ